MKTKNIFHNLCFLQRYFPDPILKIAKHIQNYTKNILN